ncbi:MAG TPA: Gfo/Idh/MocA family oxidoreductase [Thermoprotei archaeon]|nr:Gfo/Idh/MocA family oxidoreductase [Thermoprotei archaeon]
MDKVRIGVVGAGGIFRGAHLLGYVNVREAEIIAIADPSETSLKLSKNVLIKKYLEKAEEIEKEGNKEEANNLRRMVEEVKYYRDYKEMFSKEDLDLIDICTPHKYHAPIAIDALNNGFNVMVEKPMARTYIEALDIVDAVKDSGKYFQYNENLIYLPPYYLSMKLARSGEIGDLLFISIPASHGGPEWREWFWSLDTGGGGAMLDNGIHAVTLSWYIAGFDLKPVEVKSLNPYGLSIRAGFRNIGGMLREIEVEDEGVVGIRYEGDRGWVTAIVEGSWIYKNIPDYIVIGSKGYIKWEIENGREYLSIYDIHGNRRRIEIKNDWISTFEAEIRSMCLSILRNRRPIMDENIGLESIAIVDAAYYSEMLGRKPVKISDFKLYAKKLRAKLGKKASEEFMLKKLEYFKGLR